MELPAPSRALLHGFGKLKITRRGWLATACYVHTDKELCAQKEEGFLLILGALIKRQKCLWSVHLFIPTLAVETQEMLIRADSCEA